MKLRSLVPLVCLTCVMAQARHTVDYYLDVNPTEAVISKWNYYTQNLWVMNATDKEDFYVRLLVQQYINDKQEDPRTQRYYPPQGRG